MTDKKLSKKRKQLLAQGVKRVVEQYGDVLRKLGKS